MVWNCVPVQISQRSPSILTAQLSGSIGACARYGNSYSETSLVLAPGSAVSTLPFSMNTAPVVLAWAWNSAICLAVSMPPPSGGVHSILSASRPSLAAQKCLATTATPVPVGTTFSTPGTLSAALGSNLASLAPNAGGRATTAVRRPGNWTSIPNWALPVIFSGVSSRRTLVPISFQSLGSLSWTVLGGASFIAASATLPNDS